MIILRECCFTDLIKQRMIENISNKLDREGIDDFEVTDRISKDSVSISADLLKINIYIPYDFDEYEGDIDDFLSKLAPGIRTNVSYDRDVLVISSKSWKITEAQYCKLVKFIINTCGFCNILEEENY